MPKHFSVPEIESDILEILGSYESHLNLQGLSTFSDFEDDLGADHPTLLEIFIDVADKFNIDKDVLTDGSIKKVGDLVNVVASELGRG
jgi:hypothetical protein